MRLMRVIRRVDENRYSVALSWQAAAERQRPARLVAGPQERAEAEDAARLGDPVLAATEGAHQGARPVGAEAVDV